MPAAGVGNARARTRLSVIGCRFRAATDEGACSKLYERDTPKKFATVLDDWKRSTHDDSNAQKRVR
jgi:hypothetical protein